MKRWSIVLAGALMAVGGIEGVRGADEAAGPWPADVPGFVKPAPGEHPRLLFRKAGKFTPTPAGGVTVADDGAGILGFDVSGASGADALLVAVGAGLKGGANATLHEFEVEGRQVQMLAFAKGKTVPEPTADGDVITIGGQKITLAKDGLTFAVTTKPPVPAVGKPPVLPPNKNVPKADAKGDD